MLTATDICHLTSLYSRSVQVFPHDELKRLLEYGLVEAFDNALVSRRYRAIRLTARGRAHVRQMCDMPLPKCETKVLWIDAFGRPILEE